MICLGETRWLIVLETCSICGVKPAKYKCKRCGRHVCEDDYDPETGLCSVCLETNCEICGRYPAIGYCMVCGRIGCEDCLVQVSTVSYVCKDCIRSGRYRLNVKGGKASLEYSL